jgi:hypothetical protein
MNISTLAGENVAGRQSASEYPPRPTTSMATRMVASTERRFCARIRARALG